MENEIKLVNCGCGGKAYITDDRGSFTPYCFRVECSKCMVVTPFFATKKKASMVWNTAMSANKNNIAIAKGHWIMSCDGLHCSICNYKCNTTALPNICPYCGVDMQTIY